MRVRTKHTILITIQNSQPSTLLHNIFGIYLLTSSASSHTDCCVKICKENFTRQSKCVNFSHCHGRELWVVSSEISP